MIHYKVFVITIFFGSIVCADVRRANSDIFGGLFSEAIEPGHANLLYDLSLAQGKLRVPPKTTDPLEFIEQLRKSYSIVQPGSLLPRHAPKADGRLKSLLQSQEITLVIVPGIFGEFIETRAFEEVFRKTNSQFAKQWLAAVQTAKAKSPNLPNLMLEKVFDIKQNAMVDVSVDKLVHTASIDDGKNPLVRFVLFYAPRFSLETLGKSSERAKVYLRRLTTFMKLMGKEAPKNLVFVGYSRGTITALDMLSRAKDLASRHSESAESVHWLPLVKAMVSLGGVTFGSDLADDAFRKGSVGNQQLILLTQLSGSLKELESFPEKSSPVEKAQISVRNTKLAAANTKAWFGFVHDFIKTANDPTMVSTLLGTMAKSKKGEGAKSNADLIAQLIATVQEDFDLSAQAFGIDPTKFFTQYSANVRKFKNMVNELMIGVHELTTESRLAWWRDQKNKLPTDGIRYLTVAASMIDPKFETALPLSVSQNSSSYDADSIDYQLLRKNCEDFRKVSGVSLNDSQVAIHKVHLWPELAALLNPYYSINKIDSTLLGAVATHHWGLALEVVNRETGTKNPFPRIALAEAIAASVAYELSE